jgi:hypothetical protein
MISLKELNPKNFLLTDDQKNNLIDLQTRINVVRSAYGKPMYVTSGIRDLLDHRRIYIEKARRQGISNVRIPMGSKHLTGQAVDIKDSDGALYEWCKEHTTVLEQAGLYCEEATLGWVHFQSVPPKSGRRWFYP